MGAFENAVPLTLLIQLGPFYFSFLYANWFK